MEVGHFRPTPLAHEFRQVVIIFHLNRNYHEMSTYTYTCTFTAQSSPLHVPRLQNASEWCWRLSVWDLSLRKFLSRGTFARNTNGKLLRPFFIFGVHPYTYCEQMKTIFVFESCIWFELFLCLHFQKRVTSWKRSILDVSSGYGKRVPISTSYRNTWLHIGVENVTFLIRTSGSRSRATNTCGNTVQNASISIGCC